MQIKWLIKMLWNFLRILMVILKMTGFGMSSVIVGLQIISFTSYFTVCVMIFWWFDFIINQEFHKLLEKWFNLNVDDVYFVFSTTNIYLFTWVRTLI